MSAEFFVGQESDDQTPLAWMVYTVDGRSARITDNPADLKPHEKTLPLYVRPMSASEWEGLTASDVLGLWLSSKSGIGWEVYSIIADEINSFIHEKNK
jgi:hypothetical protein